MNDFHHQPKLTEAAHEAMPYSSFIGLEVWLNQQGLPLFHLPFRHSNIGNTFAPALHGGLIGGFIESAAALFVQQHNQLQEMPKMVDFSLDYLRSGKPESCFAQCTLTRQGSRIANVAVEVWQSERNKPIATARAHFLMPEAA